MSFSSDIKQELNNLKNLSNKELVKYELIGYLLSGNIDIDKNNLEFTTENDYNINRFSKLLSNLNINHNIDVSGKIFIIIVKKKEISEIVKIENNKIYFQSRVIKSNSKRNVFRIRFCKQSRKQISFRSHILK